MSFPGSCEQALTMNNITLKLQKLWTHKFTFKIMSKMLQQPNFFHSQRSTLQEDAPAKFFISMTFGVCSVARTRSSIFYAYLITTIGNRNLEVKTCFTPRNLFRAEQISYNSQLINVDVFSRFGNVHIGS